MEPGNRDLTGARAAWPTTGHDVHMSSVHDISACMLYVHVHLYMVSYVEIMMQSDPVAGWACANVTLITAGIALSSHG